MTSMARITLILFAILTSGCTTHGILSAPQKTTVASCVASCEQRAAQCHASCRNSCQQCQAYRQALTVEHFSHYAHEQYVKGDTIRRSVNSYRDPLQCRKVTCNCGSDYRICVQACGGVIKKQLQSGPVCL